MTKSCHAGDKIAAMTSFRDFCLGGPDPASPLELFFEISNVCDLKCAMCGEFSALNPHRHRALRGVDRGFFEAEELLERFDGALRGALIVHCFGYGEPTLHPDFRKIVGTLARHELMIDFITNGMHLTEDLCRFLVESGVYKVTVSFSGLSKEFYEAVYIGGDYQRVLGGLRRLADAKKRAGSPYPLVEINSLAFKQHVETFDAFVALMAGVGVDTVLLKQLQGPEYIPQIHEHVSVMRPWVEGKVVARALELGKALGVAVDPDQYVGSGASTESDYVRRTVELQARAEALGGSRRYGDNPVSAFSEIAQGIVPVAGQDRKTEATKAFSLDQSPADVRFALDVKPVEDLNGFCCLEPFKTLYVTRNGRAKPCCFGATWAWQMGDAAHDAPGEIWNGVGFETVREGIVAGEYPMELCRACLSERMAPQENGVHYLIRDYLIWHKRRFGDEMTATLRHNAPSLLSDIAGSRPSDIARRRREGMEVDEDPSTLWDWLPPASTLSEASGVLEGYLEAVNDSVVGWVWCPEDPGLRLPVSVWQNDRLIARGKAAVMRNDLARAGKGDGAYGFSIFLPLDHESDVESLFVTVGDRSDRLRFPIAR